MAELGAEPRMPGTAVVLDVRAGGVSYTAEQARWMRGVLSGTSPPITVGAQAVSTPCLIGDP